MAALEPVSASSSPSDSSLFQWVGYFGVQPLIFYPANIMTLITTEKNVPIDYDATIIGLERTLKRLSDVENVAEKVGRVSTESAWWRLWVDESLELLTEGDCCLGPFAAWNAHLCLPCKCVCCIACCVPAFVAGAITYDPNDPPKKILQR